MKKIFIFIFLSINLFAHSLVMNLYDNKDNTITVVGEFSTGEDAAGALIKIESLVSGEILFKERLPQSSELVIAIPKEPYQVVLDGGPGHTIIKEGIAPLEGFNEELKAKIDTKKFSKSQEIIGEWNIISILFFILCLILFAMAIYFSNKNTNKILQQLKEN